MTISDAAIMATHAALDPAVRDVPWTSNCASEIFLDKPDAEPLRIGHFQGDADLAAFVVAVHNKLVADLSSR